MSKYKVYLSYEKMGRDGETGNCRGSDGDIPDWYVGLCEKFNAKFLYLYFVITLKELLILHGILYLYFVIKFTEVDLTWSSSNSVDHLWLLWKLTLTGSPSWKEDIIWQFGVEEER